MLIHRKARNLIHKLSLPFPVQKYFSPDTWDIDLGSNTNPYGGLFSSYPDVMQSSLKQLYLRRIFEREEEFQPSFPLVRSNLLFTVGSLEGIDIILRALAEPGKDTVCIPYPTFSAYEHLSRLHKVKIIRTSLSGKHLTGLSLDEIISIRPKIIFLCSPNNPTGALLEPHLIPSLCESLEGFVVVDEAYIEFSTSGSFASLVHKYENLIILRTFSKAWGLAGLRCGALIAGERLINTFRYVQLPFGFSSFAENHLKKCLENGEKIQESWRKIQEERGKMYKELSILPAIKKLFQSETNFIFMILSNYKKTMGLLKNHKILISDWSSDIPDAIRVSLGTEDQNNHFLDCIRLASL